MASMSLSTFGSGDPMRGSKPEKKAKAQDNLKRKAYELRQKLACAKFVYQ